MSMKPGDTVWVFYDFEHQVLRKATLASIGKDEDNRDLFFFVFNDGTDKSEYYTYHVFPTREALCEHYRKIFE